ncbi:MAG: galactokinase [Desulfobacterales bacterium]|nr:galactokinase [Desulfobacterales bacterium]
MPLSVKKLLRSRVIEASAPCRVDAGGTWDIKAMALPMAEIDPVTINIALNLRTRVTVSSFESGRVKVSSEGFPRGEEHPAEGLPFDSPFGLFFAAISYFGFHGLQVHIKSDSPLKAALGGSSTALVALLKALSKVAVLSGKKSMSAKDILHLGYHLEDSVSSGKCGVQDQAAAVFGGVSLWRWCYGDRRAIFRRESLAETEGRKEISRRILVVFSGKSHVSSRINRGWIKDFLSGKTRGGWIEANQVVKGLGEALKEKRWKMAADLLKAEMTIRRRITPDALIPITERLIDQAEERGCGARFTGAGAGGSVWALGELDRIKDLRSTWEGTLEPVRGAKILNCGVDPVGVR